MKTQTLSNDPHRYLALYTLVGGLAVSFPPRMTPVCQAGDFFE